MSTPEEAVNAVVQQLPPPVSKSSPDVIGNILKEMNKQGIGMDLKKRNNQGNYENADSNDMNMVKSQAKLANAGIFTYICYH